jgi:hypothetical protein
MKLKNAAEAHTSGARFAGALLILKRRHELRNLNYFFIVSSQFFGDKKHRPACSDNSRPAKTPLKRCAR